MLLYAPVAGHGIAVVLPRVAHCGRTGTLQLDAGALETAQRLGRSPQMHIPIQRRVLKQAIFFLSIT